MRIKIQDFQSIKQADIDVDGFTVITGANNSGKTAVIRAVKGVVSNTGGATFVRHGAKHTSVSLEYPKAGRVIWQKGARGINRYQIDGKPFDNVGRTVPDEVAAKGIYPIQVGDKKLWPQIASQIIGQVFLLDDMGWVVAEAISDVTRVTALNKALKRSDSDRRSADAELKVRKHDHAGLLRDLQQFDGFEEVEEIVSVLERQITYGQKVVAALEKLEGLAEQIGVAQERVNKYTEVEEIEILPEETVVRAQKLERMAGQLESLELQMQRTQEKITKYEGILAEAVELDLGELEAKANKINQGIERLEDSGDRIAQALQQISHIEATQAQSEASLAKVEQEIKAILGDLEECPVCGSVVSEEQ